MEDPEPWLKIPGLYIIHLDTESVGDKFAPFIGNTLSQIINGQVLFLYLPWFAGQSPQEKSSAFRLTGRELEKKKGKQKIHIVIRIPLIHAHSEINSDVNSSRFPVLFTCFPCYWLTFLFIYLYLCIYLFIYLFIFIEWCGCRP